MLVLCEWANQWLTHDSSLVWVDRQELNMVFIMMCQTRGLFVKAVLITSFCLCSWGRTHTSQPTGRGKHACVPAGFWGENTEVQTSCNPKSKKYLFKGIVKHFGKYAHLFSFCVSVCSVWRWSQDMCSAAEHKDWRPDCWPRFGTTLYQTTCATRHYHICPHNRQHNTQIILDHRSGVSVKIISEGPLRSQLMLIT